MQTADICDFFVSLNIKKHANLQLPLNVQKLGVFWLQLDFAPGPRLGSSVVCILLH